MKSKIYFYLLIIPQFVFFNCSNNSSKINEKSDTINQNYFTKLDEISNFIKDSLKGYSLPDTTEYYHNFCFFFNRTDNPYFKDNIPFFKMADLNDDGKLDYALLLKHHDTLKVILLENRQIYFKIWIDKNFKSLINKQEGIKFGLNIEPPQKVDCVVDGEEKSLILKSNGFSLFELEKIKKIYYWEEGAFKEFIVSKL